MASSLALSTSDVELSINVCKSHTTIGASQALWETWRELTGGRLVVSENQRDRANSTSLSTFCTSHDRIMDWRSDVTSADPRRQVKSLMQHAEFQVHHSSRECWLAAIVCLTVYVCWQWQINSSLALSFSWRRGWSKHGEQCRTCIIREVLNDLNIIWASWAGRRWRRENEVWRFCPQSKSIAYCLC